MTKKEMKLLLSFCEELVDRFSTDGCNDFTFPSEWSADEKKAILAGFCTAQDPDWVVTGDEKYFNNQDVLGSLIGILRRDMEYV